MATPSRTVAEPKTLMFDLGHSWKLYLETDGSALFRNEANGRNVTLGAASLRALKSIMRALPAD